MSRNNLILPVTVRPAPSRGAVKPFWSATQARAALVARGQALAPQDLVKVLQPLTVTEQMRLQHLAMRAPEAVSLAEVLRFLPPKLAAKIMAARSKAVLEMLLAWGKSLREQAVLDKIAQKRARQRATEARQHDSARTAKANAEKARLVLAAKFAVVDSRVASWMDAETSHLAAQGMVTSGLNLPTLEALAPPMRTGFGLRVATLRLRSESFA